MSRDIITRNVLLLEKASLYAVQSCSLLNGPSGWISSFDLNSLSYNRYTVWKGFGIMITDAAICELGAKKTEDAVNF